MDQAWFLQDENVHTGILMTVGMVALVARHQKCPRKDVFLSLPQYGATPTFYVSY